MTHLSSALALLWELERGGEDYSSRLRLKCQSDLHGITWRPERSTFTTRCSPRKPKACVPSHSPLWIALSVLQLWPLLRRATEGPCPLQCPHQQCHTVLIQNQEDHGLLSSLLRVVLVFAASIMPLCIYAAMWITALFLQIHLKISSLLR